MSYKIDGESTEECKGISKKEKLILMRNIRRYFTEKVAFATQEKHGNMDVEERSFRLRKIQ